MPKNIPIICRQTRHNKKRTPHGEYQKKKKRQNVKCTENFFDRRNFPSAKLSQYSSRSFFFPQQSTCQAVTLQGFIGFLRRLSHIFTDWKDKIPSDPRSGIPHKNSSDTEQDINNIILIQHTIRTMTEVGLCTYTRAHNTVRGGMVLLCEPTSFSGDMFTPKALYEQ